MLLVAAETLIDLTIDVDGQASVVLGGAPFNTARACGRLGCDGAFVGAISNDRFGSMLTQQLEPDGVSTSLSTRVDEPITFATAELDDGGVAKYLSTSAEPPAPQLAEPPTNRDSSAVFAGGLGPSVASAARFVDLDDFGFVSTAGGALIRFVGGQTLPLLEALRSPSPERCPAVPASSDFDHFVKQNV